MTNQKIIKIILGGESGTGKTSFIKRLSKGIFSQIEQPTIDSEFYTIKQALDSGELIIQVSDLSGSPQFRFLQDVQVKGASGAILFFTNDYSLAKIPEWIAFIRKNSSRQDIPTLIVRAKSDIQSDSAAKQKLEKLRNEYNMAEVIEMSAKTGDNVDKVMDTIVKMVLELPVNKTSEFVREEPSITRGEKIRAGSERPKPPSPEKTISEPIKKTSEVKVKIESGPTQVQKVPMETTDEKDGEISGDSFDLFTFIEESRKVTRSLMFLDIEAAGKHLDNARKELRKIMGIFLPRKKRA
ncbi:MAG: Rab family GTPase [Candidatus Helarchaeota archaeon]